MDYTIAPNVTAIGSGDTAPTTGTKGEFTSGNPATNTPATTLPGYQMNALVEEVINVITAAGIAPNNQVNSQLLQALFGLPGKNIEVFWSSGTFTVPASVTKVRAKVWGAGGGGGGCAAGSDAAGGGAGGGYSDGVFTVVPGTKITVTIGLGGGGGTPGNGGSAGGTTSFGAYNSATGGGGAPGCAVNATSAGSTSPGTGVGGIINMSGGEGLGGANVGTNYASGAGGGVPFLSGATPGVFSSTTGPDGQPGAGGAGGAYGGGGGSGGGGLVIVEW